LDLLKILESKEVDIDILRLTKIGVIVNKVKKHFSSDTVQHKLSKELISRWKSIADNSSNLKQSENQQMSERNESSRSNINSPRDCCDETERHYDELPENRRKVCHTQPRHC
jgi:hypothetical protein